MMEGPPTFIADAMLGRLARWLRLAGYDTLYDTRLSDRELADLARRTNRVLLTRDHELAGRRGVRSLLVLSDRTPDQLKQVSACHALHGLAGGPRCPRCNGTLEALAAADAPPSVPDYLRDGRTSLRRCQRCGHVYWRGSHWVGIQRGWAEARPQT